MGVVEQSLILAADGHQLGARSQSVGAWIGGARVQLRRQASHANHEELVEIGAEDGEELDAFQQRVLIVLGFLQHAPLERQQAEFAIQIKRRIFEIDLRHDGRRCALGNRGCGGGFRRSLPFWHRFAVTSLTFSTARRKCGPANVTDS